MASVIDAKRFYPGDVVRESVFTHTGIKLLAPGTRLTSALVKALRDTGETSFVVASSRAQVGQARAQPRVPTRVRTNRPSRPVLPEETVGGAGMGPDAGMIVAAMETDELPGPVQRRDWAVRMPEVRRVRRAMLREAERIVGEHEPRWSCLPLMLPRALPALALPEIELPGWLSEHEQRALRSQRVEQIARVHRNLGEGQPVSFAEVAEVAEEALLLTLRHPRRVCELALRPEPAGEAIADHAYRVCVLSVALAVRRGCGKNEAIDAGVTALLADVGVKTQGRAWHTLPRPLDDSELAGVRRHPVLSAALLLEIEDLPERVALGVLQHHERPDGCGYPRGLRTDQTCELARVVGVADTLCALAHERPHRPAHAVHAALRQTLRLARAGRLDRACAAALVALLGIHPIGTRVKLSSGVMARVIGAGGPGIDRPLVRPEHDGQVVNLALRPDLRVERLVE